MAAEKRVEVGILPYEDGSGWRFDLTVFSSGGGSAVIEIGDRANCVLVDADDWAALSDAVNR